MTSSETLDLMIERAMLEAEDNASFARFLQEMKKEKSEESAHKPC